MSDANPHPSTETDLDPDRDGNQTFGEWYASENEARILHALAHLHHRRGRSYVKTRHVADALGLSSQRCRHVMPALEARGWVSVWNPGSGPCRTWRIMLTCDESPESE